MSLGPLFCGDGLCAWRLVDAQSKALRPSELKAPELPKWVNKFRAWTGGAFTDIPQLPRAAQGHQSLLSQAGGGQGHPPLTVRPEQAAALPGPPAPLLGSPCVAGGGDGAQGFSLRSKHPATGILDPREGRCSEVCGHKRAPEPHLAGSAVELCLGGGLGAGTESRGVGCSYLRPPPGKAPSAL